VGVAEVVIVLAVLLTLVLVAGQRGKQAKVPVRRLEHVALPVELQLRVRQLDAEGRRITAIKELREATGLGLADAKRAVEQIAAGGSFPTPGSAPVRPGPTLADRVRPLVAAGREDEAARVVATETGLTGPEAAAFVRALRG
jgi:large subunit ribosomal protein L7/L12